VPAASITGNTAGHEERAAQVGAQHAVPLDDRRLVAASGGPATGDAGVVEQHVDSSELVDHPVHGALDGLGVAHIDGEGQPVGARGRLGGVAVEVEHREPQPVVEQPLAARPADAGAAAGHHGHPSFVRSHPATVGRRWCPPIRPTGTSLVDRP
jgi:hypothetical protein